MMVIVVLYYSLTDIFETDINIWGFKLYCLNLKLTVIEI